MCSALQSEIFALAEAVRSACASFAGGSAGNCKDAILSPARTLDPVHEPVAICQGQVVVDGTEHDHYWCRIGQTIIDPTADQFRAESGPLIAPETSLPHYREASFFVFTPTAVVRLLQAARPNNPFKPKPLRISLNSCVLLQIG
jgi:hypothetical protein